VSKSLVLAGHSSKNKKAVSRRVKKSFSEFFHHFPQINIAKLTCQVKIESQFYPFGLKMQDLF
jgi:hypothetical protein